MHNILEVAVKLDLEKNINLTADGDLEIVIPLLKTNYASINICLKIDGEFLKIKIEAENIGNDNNSLMEFIYNVTNYFMKNIGNVNFQSSLNFAVTTVELYTGNTEFIASVVSRIIEIFNSHKYSIEKEIVANNKK